MFKKFLIIPTAAIIFFSCEKSKAPYSCTPTNPSVTVPDSQLVALQNYLAAKGLMGVVTRDSHDFYYKIEAAGSGVTPNTCSNVVVAYEGRLATDSVFTTPEELSNPRTLTLNQLIPGWQLGLQLVQKAGRIKLYLPPVLGYGAAGSGVVPGNSIIIFDILLNDVTN